MWSKPVYQPLCGLAVVASLLGAGVPARAGEEVRVTVVAILATSNPKDTHIDPAVAPIAQEVKKKYPSLTGFHLSRMTCESMTVGKKDTFPLVDHQVATVVVEEPADKDNRVRLRVKPPELGEFTYTTCCGKYFPLVTPYHTKDKDQQLIIAVMVSPCKDK